MCKSPLVRESVKAYTPVIIQRNAATDEKPLACFYDLKGIKAKEILYCYEMV